LAGRGLGEKSLRSMTENRTSYIYSTESWVKVNARRKPVQPAAKEEIAKME